jgi:hypothetical protein
MGHDPPREPGAKELRSLAAQYRSRAERAKPDIATLLNEMADDLEAEAKRADALISVNPASRRYYLLPRTPPSIPTRCGPPPQSPS